MALRDRVITCNIAHIAGLSADLMSTSNDKHKEPIFHAKEVYWRNNSESATFCFLDSFSFIKPKSIYLLSHPCDNMVFERFKESIIWVHPLYNNRSLGVNGNVRLLTKAEYIFINKMLDKFSYS